MRGSDAGHDYANVSAERSGEWHDCANAGDRADGGVDIGGAVGGPIWEKASVGGVIADYFGSAVCFTEHGGRIRIGADGLVYAGFRGRHSGDGGKCFGERYQCGASSFDLEFFEPFLWSGHDGDAVGEREHLGE